MALAVALRCGGDDEMDGHGLDDDGDGDDGEQLQELAVEYYH